MPKRVDLDAMIPREDFDVIEEAGRSTDFFRDFPLSHLKPESPYLKLLRKPDFQRETNHWAPEQVVSLITSFVDDEVIPSLILWKAPRYIFVIDGGHRLSALRAWIQDDYGDGAISLGFYKGEIPKQQRDVARFTRQMVERQVGRYAALQSLLNVSNAPEVSQSRAQIMLTRALPLQWIQGNSKAAESSFFKINSQGTPLDATEEMLIRHRSTALAISARAILRAGSGHTYWSSFDAGVRQKVEDKAQEFHERIFRPEATQPLKTLELPLGGTVSPVEALALLIDFLAIAGSREKDGKSIAMYGPDQEGVETLQVLKNALQVLNRISGNDAPSLGLHPAVYFYNERGKYSRFLFLGMTLLVQEAIRNNDGEFFHKFTRIRKDFEAFLLENKSLIGIVLQNLSKGQRVQKVRQMFDLMIRWLSKGEAPNMLTLIGELGLKGRVLDVTSARNSPAISDETKTLVYVKQAIANALHCPICDGILDQTKSVSYDHGIPVRSGGSGDETNVRMAHPFCNTGFKERLEAAQASASHRKHE